MQKKKKFKIKKVKKALPAIFLIPSLYYSFLFTAGVVVGYILCKLFCHLFVHNGKIDSVYVNFGQWQLHLHHWIMGLAVFGILWTIDYLYLPTFFIGAICGAILQDIYDYNDWHKVIIKNPTHSKTSDKPAQII